MHKPDSLQTAHCVQFSFAFTLLTLFMNSRSVKNLSQKTPLWNIAEAKLDCNDCLFIMHLNSEADFPGLSV